MALALVVLPICTFDPGLPGLGGPAIVQTMVEADGGACDVSSYGRCNGGFYHTRTQESRATGMATLVFYNLEGRVTALALLAPRRQW